MSSKQEITDMSTDLPAASTPTGLDTDSVASQACATGTPESSDLSDIIDWDNLIERIGDEEILRAVMPDYVQNIEEHYAQLSQAVENGNCLDMASHAHALKGVGRNLSITRLSEIAGRMEHLARQNDIKAATQLFGDVQTETERALAALARSDWIKSSG